MRSTLGLDSRPVVLLATNVIGDSLTLGRQVFSDSMTEWLRRTIEYFAHNSGAQLVVFDSLHDFFAGNENHRGHARNFIALLRRLAREIDGTVVVTGHPSVYGLRSGTGSSGNTAWRDTWPEAGCRGRSP